MLKNVCYGDVPQMQEEFFFSAISFCWELVVLLRPIYRRCNCVMLRFVRIKFLTKIKPFCFEHFVYFRDSVVKYL